MYETKRVIESKIGCKLVDNPITPPFVYSSTTIPLLYSEALNIALGTPPQTPLEEHITTDTDSGDVRYESGHILAKAPGEEEECKRNILSAFKDITGSTESKKVAQTHKEAQEAMTKLKRAAEEITLLGLVTGRCRVCQRLGM